MTSPPPVPSLEDAARLEAAGRLSAALEAYEAVLARGGEDVEALCGLARIAGRLDMAAQALALWEQVAALDPARLEAVDGRARMLAELGRGGEAVEALREAILAHPHEARLWTALGVLMAQQGDGLAALSFLDEALRLEPTHAAALYNRGDVRFDLGDLAYAEADFDVAARCATSPQQTAQIAFARALLALHRGDLALGWAGYEARLSPDHPTAPAFQVEGAAWTQGAELDGARLLVVGEQGLGDEIMFAGVLDDVASALGPHGRLSVAVEPRLVALFARSFPAAHVFAHTTGRREGRAYRGLSAPTGGRAAQLWAPLASLPGRFRPTLESFPRTAYLRPDPARVAHWRRWVEGRRPVGGLSWRSGLLTGRRRRQYPELQAWSPVLQTPGVSLVNLQYEATRAELDALEDLAGAPLLTPPDLDLKTDLDDLAALCLAMDVVVSVPNATAALAAACGAPVWFLTGPGAWPKLGTDGYPWYANARSFPAASFGAWEAPLAAVAEALHSLSAEDR